MVGKKLPAILFYSVCFLTNIKMINKKNIYMFDYFMFYSFIYLNGKEDLASNT